MTRRSYEIDLPARVAEHFAPAIDAWIGSAIPGSQLNIPLASPFMSPFVTSSSLERNTICLRAVELSSSTGPCILVEPADAASRRLIDQEDKRLTPKPFAIESIPLTPRTVHIGGSRPLNTGTPAVGSLSW